MAGREGGHPPVPVMCQSPLVKTRIMHSGSTDNTQTHHLQLPHDAVPISLAGRKNILFSTFPFLLCNRYVELTSMRAGK